MYTKIIKAGSVLEIFTYEKDLPKRIKGTRAKKSVIRSSRSWSNVRRLQKSFYRLVRSNLGGKEIPALLTLTMYSIVGIDTAYGCITAFFRRFRESVFGSDFKYLAVPEFQKRGAVHFHVLVWGLPNEVIEKESSTRFIQSRWLYGFCDIVTTDGSPKLAGYLGKYMLKSVQDPRMFRKKSYTASRNLLRPVCLSGEVQTSYFNDIIDVDKFKLDKEYTFPTEWMGRCKYQRFNSS